MITELDFKKFLNRNLALGEWIDMGYDHDIQNLFFAVNPPELWISNSIYRKTPYWYDLDCKWIRELMDTGNYNKGG